MISNSLTNLVEKPSYFPHIDSHTPNLKDVFFLILPEFWEISISGPPGFSGKVFIKRHKMSYNQPGTFKFLPNPSSLNCQQNYGNLLNFSDRDVLIHYSQYDFENALQLTILLLTPIRWKNRNIYETIDKLYLANSLRMVFYIPSLAPKFAFSR